MLTCTCIMHMSYGLHCMLNTWKEKKTTTTKFSRSNMVRLMILVAMIFVTLTCHESVVHIKLFSVKKFVFWVHVLKFKKKKYFCLFHVSICT